jgi:hypothetical protein
LINEKSKFILASAIVASATPVTNEPVTFPMFAMITKSAVAKIQSVKCMG